jgi:hypothetical protein
MTRSSFLYQLKTNGIDTSLVSFYPNLRDGYCVRKNRCGWTVFVLERGLEYDSMGFPSESDALHYLFKQLLSLYGNNISM